MVFHDACWIQGCRSGPSNWQHPIRSNQAPSLCLPELKFQCLGLGSGNTSALWSSQNYYPPSKHFFRRTPSRFSSLLGDDLVGTTSAVDLSKGGEENPGTRFWQIVEDGMLSGGLLLPEFVSKHPARRDEDVATMPSWHIVNGWVGGGSRAVHC